MKNTRIFLFSCLIASYFWMTALAGYEEDRFFEANKQYSEGNYTGAATLYGEIIARGVKSGNIYYNLGNAYFKMGDNGRALLNYERAWKLIPNDEDLFANTAFVKTVLDVQQPEEDYLWYEKIYIAVRDAFSTGVWFSGSVLLFYLISVFLGVSFFVFPFRKTAYIISSVLGIFLIISVFFCTKSYHVNQNVQRGVIVVPKTEVRYSPSYSGSIAFKLSEGIRASILREEGEWSQIRINRKNSGWVETEAIEKI
ncbi:MAG: tetratricopeptide repeat protein [Elusimicrobiota bacterium]